MSRKNLFIIIITKKKAVLLSKALQFKDYLDWK